MQTVKDLGTLGCPFSGANDINDSGEVVGYSQNPSESRLHAFLYSDSEEEFEEAGKLVRWYKQVRDVVQEGDQYRLLSPREGETAAVQNVSED